MSEWLGTGLQNRSQRFESAWHLSIKKPAFPCGLFFYTLFYTLYIYTLTNTLLYTYEHPDKKQPWGGASWSLHKRAFPLAPTHGNYAINNPG